MTKKMILNKNLITTFFTPLLCLILAMSLLHTQSATSESSSQLQRLFSPYTRETVRAAYWPSGDSLSPSSIDTNYFTHIYYAFIEPEPTTFGLAVTDSHKKYFPEFIDGLASRSPPVKTLLSIGGGSSNATLFSIIASTKQNREAFINSTIQVAREYGFNGLDLDWEFPGDQKDMSNLGLLFKEWYQALVSEARAYSRPRLLLTAAVYYANTIKLIGNGPRSYPAQPIQDYLDWASPMCFDYHGTWDNFTGYNAALFDSKSNISTRYGLSSWVKSGVHPAKLVFGLPLYGRAWKLRNQSVHGPGAAAVGEAPGTDGMMDYDEILQFNKEKDATVVYDKMAVSYYSYAGTTWVSYDDGPSVTRKVKYAKLLGLKGYFFWAVGKDKDWNISRQASNTLLGH